MARQEPIDRIGQSPRRLRHEPRIRGGRRAHHEVKTPSACIATPSGGLTVASERGHRAIQARALRLLGEIASRFDPPHVQQAEAQYRQARALAEELGMRPLIGHCHLGLGKLYGRTGKREQAREHPTTATTMYHEMDMRFWLEQAEAALGGGR